LDFGNEKKATVYCWRKKMIERSGGAVLYSDETSVGRETMADIKMMAKVRWTLPHERTFYEN